MSSTRADSLPRVRRRSALRAASLAGLLTMAALATPVHAEVWVFVDEQGVSHFAPQQVDARYTLFFKGRSSLDPPLAGAPASPALLLQDHPTYKRVANNPNVQRFAPLIAANARANGLDPALVTALIAVESAFDPAAVSSKGAIGLMQVMPDTAERYGVVGDARRSAGQKLGEPAINVRVGSRYLRDLLKRYDDDLPLTLAAYNAGEGAVDRNDRSVPPYPETVDYVRLVQLFRDYYKPPPPAPAPVPSPRVTLQTRRTAP